MPLNKYDESSYIKHSRLTVHGANFIPLEDKLRSQSLLIKWHCLKALTEQPNKQTQGKGLVIIKGICEQRVNTPIGDLFPQQYPLKIAVGNHNLIEPLQLNNVDYEYSLYFQNPTTVQMSQVEVWEFKE
jgi:hypothetical protein